MANPTVPEILTGLVRRAIAAAGLGNGDDPIDPVVASNKPQFGDYQSNHAFRVGKANGLNPRAAGQKIHDHLPEHPAIAKTAVAGPGFINFFIDDDWLCGHIIEMVGDEHLNLPQSGAGKTLVIDYSSPNIAKRMHIGHMRSTIIGNTMLRLHQAAGWNTVADNHIGDWGTPIGKIIVAWKGWRDEDNLAADPIGELERLYVSFGQKAENDDTLIEQAREETARLQAGDPENRALWQRFLEISGIERDDIYNRIGATFDVTLGESFYNDMLAGVVEDLLKHDVATISDGAVIVQFPEDAQPKMLRETTVVIRKADGAALYATTDLATLEYRMKEYAPDRILYLTGREQQLHFQQFFAAWNQLRAARGVEDTASPELIHLWFGMLKVDGAIPSTRRGGTIRLAELLDKAVEEARKVVEDASPELSGEEKDHVASVVGVNTIRYFDLSQNPQSTVNFEWARALSLQGNTAPYMMYAVARIRSIQRKAGVEAALSNLAITNPKERALLIQLLKLPDAITAALETQRPNLLCEYLYEVAGMLNSFYAVSRVLGSDEQASRLAFIEAVARVLEYGLDLLGIRTLERM
ncbi:MAG: arginine--tRNA ligase [Myxococcota bacterium]